MPKTLFKIARLLRDTRGVAAVEFAFAFPILILLLVGTLDIGRALWYTSTLDHAAREGARYASLRGAESLYPASDAEIQAFVRNRAIGINSSNLTVSVAWAPNSYSGGYVTIQVAQPFGFLLTGFLDLSPLNLTGESTMTVL
ncbi:MAG: pilus assembly protein [Proteobacteria bacterium]|nr:pilus assembly protein [Pseudomonadota bacterium]